ncbi:MAG: hypothetical protein R2843_01950 [Thermomicrobiales bacterium]
MSDNEQNGTPGDELTSPTNDGVRKRRRRRRRRSSSSTQQTATNQQTATQEPAEAAPSSDSPDEPAAEQSSAPRRRRRRRRSSSSSATPATETAAQTPAATVMWHRPVDRTAKTIPRLVRTRAVPGTVLRNRLSSRTSDAPRPAPCG